MTSGALVVDMRVEGEGWPPASKQIVQAAATAALEVLNAPLGRMELSVLLTQDAQIQDLNAQYRNVDAPTDVLSWPAQEHLAPVARGAWLQEGAPIFLGDVALGLGYIVKAAKEREAPLEDHMRHLIVHGVLHLVGYDHVRDEEAKLMQSLEIEALASLGVENPYAPQE